MRRSDQVKTPFVGSLQDGRARYPTLSVRLIQLLCEGSVNGPRHEANRAAKLLCISYISEAAALPRPEAQSSDAEKPEPPGFVSSSHYFGFACLIFPIGR